MTALSTPHRVGRIIVAVLAGLLAAAVVLAVGGGPGSSGFGGVALGAVATVVAGLATWRVASGGARSGSASLDPLTAVIDRVARPAPLDEVLQQVVDALRHGSGRRAVEIWCVVGDQLVLTHRRPLVDRDPVELDATVVAAATNAGIVGDAWLRTWLPSFVGDATATERTRATPLALQGELAGVVALRRNADDVPFGRADDDRLARLARPLAAALNQARLTRELEQSVDELGRRNDDLQASRARLVAVADAERRRIERDLHDGVQARLTALTMKVQRVQHRLGQNHDDVARLLDEVEDELVESAADLRILAHGIVPPLLLTGGLGDALRGVASRSPMPVTVDVPGSDRLRPEVETAVYYCCVEALQNAAKHAGDGASAQVRVVRDSTRLRFEVVDDGVGLPPDVTTGHGLDNMADRIGALGGTVVISSGIGGQGVRVAGQVPVGPDDVADK